MDIDFIIEPYIIIQQLGEGTYGRVFKAQNKITQEIVAIKQIQTNDEERQEGVQSTTLREMSVLSLFKGNPNIVQLKDVILADNYKQFIVMEFIETDLRSLIEKASLTENQVKLYLYQLLKGLYALHSRHIFHRDLKPGNILVQNGVAKLADFGLAKPIGSPIDRLHTREVQTLWYRAPELLLGNFHYSPALDIFSLGCIFFEMLNRQTLFKGNSEIEQLFKIFQMVGTPTDWKGFTAMPYYSVKFPHFRASWQDTPNMSAKGKVLLRDMLAIDPCERISAKDALKHPYFDDINKLC